MCAHLFLWEHQNHNKLLNNHWQEDTGSYQKKYSPRPKTKKKLKQDDGEAQSKWNQISYPSGGWPTNCRIIPKLFSPCSEYSEPHQDSRPGDLPKGLGIPRESDLEGQQDLIIRLPQDWGKQRFQSWRAQIKPCMHPRLRGKKQWLHRSQNYLLVLDSLLWRSGLAGLTTGGMGGLTAAVWKVPLWHKISWRPQLTGP